MEFIGTVKKDIFKCGISRTLLTVPMIKVVSFENRSYIISVDKIRGPGQMCFIARYAAIFGDANEIHIENAIFFKYRWTISKIIFPFYYRTKFDGCFEFIIILDIFVLII